MLLPLPANKNKNNQNQLPGKLNRLSRWPMGDGFGGGVALGGLEDWKGAGEDGVEEVVEDGLLLESRWFTTGGWS